MAVAVTKKFSSVAPSNCLCNFPCILCPLAFRLKKCFLIRTYNELSSLAICISNLLKVSPKLSVLFPLKHFQFVGSVSEITNRVPREVRVTYSVLDVKSQSKRRNEHKETSFCVWKSHVDLSDFLPAVRKQKFLSGSGEVMLCTSISKHLVMHCNELGGKCLFASVKQEVKNKKGLNRQPEINPVVAEKS